MNDNSNSPEFASFLSFTCESVIFWPCFICTDFWGLTNSAVEMLSYCTATLKWQRWDRKGHTWQGNQAGDYFGFSTAKRGTILCHRDGAGASVMGHTFSSLIRSIRSTSLQKISTP